MARRKKVNMSEKIREYLGANPDAGPAQAARDLKEFGVTPALVANVKSRMNLPGRRKRRQRKAAPTAARTNRAPGRKSKRQEVPIVAAAELIRLCGGVDEAKAALETAGQVASVLG